MAFTADQYRTNAETALGKANTAAATQGSAPSAQAQAYAGIAAVYVSLYEATKGEV